MEKLLVSGVYSISFTEDSRKYVGAAFDMYDRKKRHVYRLRLGNHSNKQLQEAFNTYGEGCLLFVVLEECVPSLCKAKERHWAKHFSDTAFKTESAGFTSGTPGTPHSQKTKRKISQALTGKKKTEEHRSNLWKNRQGWKHTEESKKKTSKTLRKKIANGESFGWQKGKKHSDESKAKMSAAQKGVPKSVEHKAKISAALKALAKKRR